MKVARFIYFLFAYDVGSVPTKQKMKGVFIIFFCCSPFPSPPRANKAQNKNKNKKRKNGLILFYELNFYHFLKSKAASVRYFNNII